MIMKSASEVFTFKLQDDEDLTALCGRIARVLYSLLHLDDVWCEHAGKRDSLISNFQESLLNKLTPGVEKPFSVRFRLDDNILNSWVFKPIYRSSCLISLKVSSSIPLHSLDVDLNGVKELAKESVQEIQKLDDPDN